MSVAIISSISVWCLPSGAYNTSQDAAQSGQTHPDSNATSTTTNLLCNLTASYSSSPREFSSLSLDHSPPTHHYPRWSSCLQSVGHGHTHTHTHTLSLSLSLSPIPTQFSARNHLSTWMLRCPWSDSPHFHLKKAFHLFSITMCSL